MPALDYNCGDATSFPSVPSGDNVGCVLDGGGSGPESSGAC
jgi:hypothetical protein